jgi:hypothetical protein
MRAKVHFLCRGADWKVSTSAPHSKGGVRVQPLRSILRWFMPGGCLQDLPYALPLLSEHFLILQARAASRQM